MDSPQFHGKAQFKHIKWNRIVYVETISKFLGNYSSGVKIWEAEGRFHGFLLLCNFCIFGMLITFFHLTLTIKMLLISKW